MRSQRSAAISCRRVRVRARVRVRVRVRLRVRYRVTEAVKGGG